MNTTLAGTFIALTLLYAIIVLVLFSVLRFAGLRKNHAAAFSLTIFGVVAGLAALFAWPHDLALYVNLYGVLLGDQIYHAATAMVDPARAADAHHAVFWLFRVPQVYLLASLIVYGFAAILSLFLKRADPPAGRSRD